MIYTLAGMLPMASAIILLPFYIDELSTTLYGELSIYLAFSLLVQVLVTYSFDSSLYIHYHEFKHDKAKLSVFVSSSFIFMLLLGLAVGIVLTGIGDFLFNLLLKDSPASFYPFGLSATGIGMFQAFFRVYSNLIQTQEKSETYLWSNILMFSLIAAFTVIGLQIFPASLIGPVHGRLVASIAVGGWALYRIFKEFGIHFDFQWLRKSFNFNNYTFLYQVLQWVINYFDRFLIAFFLPVAAVGVYDFAMKCMVGIEVILNGLHNSYYPKVVSGIMAQEKKGSTIALNRYYYGNTAVIMLLICICILVLPIGVDVFIKKPDYRDAIPYLPFVACIYFFRTTRLYFAVPYGILKHVKRLPVIYLIISAVKIGLMVALLPFVGIYGVIVASIVSSVIELPLLRYYIHRDFAFQFNSAKLIFGPVILLLIIGIIEPRIGASYPTVVHTFYLVACGGLLLWMYRNEIGLILPVDKFIKK
jgi:O-antigen/teichoic acid export membrane protein